MSIQARPKHGVQSTSGSLTGAAPQTADSATLLLTSVQTGSLSVTLTTLVTVNLLTITGKWQVSSDGTTWDDCFPSNAAAQVTIQTGTGSGVTVTRRIDAPASVYGELYGRYRISTGAQAAGGAGSEDYTMAYNYRQFV